jgi:hypothetical protein
MAQYRAPLHVPLRSAPIGRMHALTLAAFLCAQPPDDTLVWVKFDTLTLKDAERLDSKTVATTFTVGAHRLPGVKGRTSLR